MPQAVGDYVDVINISGYDYGAQNREMFRPELFQRFYVPAWQMYIQALKRQLPARPRLGSTVVARCPT